MAIRSTARGTWVRRFALLGVPFIVAGCEAIVPALVSLGAALTQDLLAAASVNYAPRYAIQVEDLLTAMASQLSGQQLQPQLAQQGYVPPPPEYVRDQQQGYGRDPYGQTGYPNNYPQQNDPYAYNDPYASNDPYAANNPNAARDPYTTGQSGSDPYGAGNDPYASSSNPGAAPNDPYANASGPYASGTDPYAAGRDPYATSPSANDPYAPNAGPYASQGNDPYANPGRSPPLTRSARPPIEVQVALLVQRAGTDTLEPIRDGDVLHDGRGDPTAGDLLKVHVSANCACYLYIIGVDATGFVAQVFPDPDAGHANPVKTGERYMIPEGNDWLGLDDYRGVEQVYFVASHHRQPDIEEALTALVGQPRILATPEYQPVREPAIVRTTRGLVKVTVAEPVTVPTTTNVRREVLPTRFLASDVDTLVLTRWFDHQ